MSLDFPDNLLNLHPAIRGHLYLQVALSGEDHLVKGKILLEAFHKEGHPGIKAIIREFLNGLIKRETPRGQDENFKRLIKVLDCPDPQIVKRAFLYALKHEREDLLPAMQAVARKSKSMFFQSCIIRLIGSFGIRYFSLIPPSLASKNPTLIRVCLESIERMGAQGCLKIYPSLVAFCRHPSKEISTLSISLLQSIHPKVHEVLLTQWIQEDQTALPCVAHAMKVLPHTHSLFEALPGLAEETRQSLEVDFEGKTLLSKDQNESQGELIPKNLGNSFPAMVKHLQGLAPESFWAALKQLKTQNSHDGIESFLYHFSKHNNPEKRLMVTHFIAQNPGLTDETVLLAQLEDSDVRCAGAAIISLGTNPQFKEDYRKELNKALSRLARDRSLEFRAQALHCIAILQDEKFLEILEFLIFGKAGEMQNAVRSRLRGWASFSEPVRELVQRFEEVSQEFKEWDSSLEGECQDLAQAETWPSIHPDVKEVPINPDKTDCDAPREVILSNLMLTDTPDKVDLISSLIPRETHLDSRRKMLICLEQLSESRASEISLPKDMEAGLIDDDFNSTKKVLIYCVNQGLPCPESLKKKVKSLDVSYLTVCLIRLAAMHWPRCHEEMLEHLRKDDQRIIITTLREMFNSFGFENSIYFPYLAWFSIHPNRSVAQVAKSLLAKIPNPSLCYLYSQMAVSKNTDRQRTALLSVQSLKEEGLDSVLETLAQSSEMTIAYSAGAFLKESQKKSSSRIEQEKSILAMQVAEVRTRATAGNGPDSLAALKQLAEAKDSPDFFLQFLEHNDSEFLQIAILVIHTDHEMYLENFKRIQKALTHLGRAKDLDLNINALNIMKVLEDENLLETITFILFLLLNKTDQAPVLAHQTLSWWANRSQRAREVLLQFQQSQVAFDTWDERENKDPLLLNWLFLNLLLETLLGSDEARKLSLLSQLRPGNEQLDESEVIRILKEGLGLEQSTEIISQILLQIGRFSYFDEYSFVKHYLDHENLQVATSAVRALCEMKNLRVLDRVLPLLEEDISQGHNLEILQSALPLLNHESPDLALEALKKMSRGDERAQNVFIKELETWGNPSDDLKIHLIQLMQKNSSEFLCESAFRAMNQYGSSTDLVLISRAKEEVKNPERGELLSALATSIDRRLKTEFRTKREEVKAWVQKVEEKKTTKARGRLWVALAASLVMGGFFLYAIIKSGTNPSPSKEMGATRVVEHPGILKFFTDSPESLIGKLMKAPAVVQEVSGEKLSVRVNHRRLILLFKGQNLQPSAYPKGSRVLIKGSFLERGSLGTVVLEGILVKVLKKQVTPEKKRKKMRKKTWDLSGIKDELEKQ
jgi:hypothetical protein